MILYRVNIKQEGFSGLLGVWFVGKQEARIFAATVPLPPGQEIASINEIYIPTLARDTMVQWLNEQCTIYVEKVHVLEEKEEGERRNIVRRTSREPSHHDDDK